MTAQIRRPEEVMQLAATDTALGCAERETWRVVNAWSLHSIAAVVELLAQELVTVAIGRIERKHSDYRRLQRIRLIDLRFQLTPDGVVIATWDSNPQPPSIRRPDTAENGGLYWVPMLSEAWDYFPSAGGKIVWAEVALPQRGQTPLPRRTSSRDRSWPPTLPDIALLERVRQRLLQLDTG